MAVGPGPVGVVGWVLALLALVAPAAGCGPEDSEAPRAGSTVAPREGEPPTPASEPSPSCDAACQARREERRARDEERCDALTRRVDLTWQITATPAGGGQEIGLRMLVVNRSDTRLSGDTWGSLRVEPGRGNGIRWGGSSADVLWQRPHTTSDREVWHERRPPGWHPVGEQVTAFTYDAYSYAPGRPTLVCHFPATVEAPPGLVEGHPSGSWTQQPDR